MRQSIMGACNIHVMQHYYADEIKDEPSSD